MGKGKGGFIKFVANVPCLGPLFFLRRVSMASAMIAALKMERKLKSNLCVLSIFIKRESNYYRQFKSTYDVKAMNRLNILNNLYTQRIKSSNNIEIVRNNFNKRNNINSEKVAILKKIAYRLKKRDFITSDSDKKE